MATRAKVPLIHSRHSRKYLLNPTSPQTGPVCQCIQEYIALFHFCQQAHNWMVQVEPPTNHPVTGSAVWLSSHWHDNYRLTNGLNAWTGCCTSRTFTYRVFCGVRVVTWHFKRRFEMLNYLIELGWKAMIWVVSVQLNARCEEHLWMQ